MSLDDLSTTHLLGLWRDGRADAVDALFARHLSWVSRVVSERLGPALRRKLETGDIVQDALMRFLNDGPRITVDNERRFRGLMVRIAENVIRDESDYWTARRRDLAREQSFSDHIVLDLDGEGAAARPSEPDSFDKAEAFARLRLALELLRPNQREIYLRRVRDGWTHRRIADHFDITEDAAQKRYARAAARLTELAESIKARDIDGVIGEGGDKDDELDCV